ncbi:universal stress protein [Candidatus Sulfidibacterium hydrothermale]|uniref:universal stress protein n=1 Tax=Candidatus Sulfidibacterium hydrothermale TaxID=2875962 RepID=UPI001F0B5550|nr:universal stress protein [Candidatus Sulfidibacterium hydrothermale]UBM62840.1 universal stress protein [Candidatus Sulfidibacterium hydrothermale]
MSKNIVVGVDFSDCSLNALEHAVIISRKAKASLTMVWANHLDYSKEIFSVEPENLRQEVQKRFEELVGKYQPQLAPGTQIDFRMEKGKVYKVICHVAKEKDAFLVVIGTHGSSGFEEFWIGSNANRIVSASTRPILTIRAGVDSNKDLKTIVMPLDSTRITRQKLPVTAELAGYFDAEIHIVGVYTSTAESIRYRVQNYVQETETYLKEKGIRYRSVFLEASNITDTVLEYAQKVNANLISIMTEQETTTANLWLGPFAAQMVNHSPIPVLSVHTDNSGHWV